MSRRPRRWASAPLADGRPAREVGAEAARRALRVRGTPSLDRDPLVVELVPEANIAAGELAYGSPTSGRARSASACGEGSPDPAGRSRRPEPAARVVTRDAGRHEWQQARVWELLVLRPDAVVVETGVPGGVAAAIETHGAGRANLEAARAELAGRSGARDGLSRTTSV